MENLRNSHEIGEQEILVASFGTRYAEQRTRAIAAIEEAIEETFPQWDVRRAFTSQMILKNLRKHDGLAIDDVREALENARNAGVKRLVIQPALIMEGIEYNDICALGRNYIDSFEKICIGKPLFSSEDDYKRIMRAIVADTAAYQDGETAICYMGHGTTVEANRVYCKLQQKFNSAGFDQYLVGTVESDPDVTHLMAKVKAGKYKRIVLRPLMIVAGDHAHQDMAGDAADSWKSLFEAEGYEVICELKGLGEMEEIQNLMVQHTKDAMRDLDEADYFDLGEFHVRPGEKQQGHLYVDRTAFTLHATVIRGYRPGKVLLLTGGVHSCEYVGIQALIELADKLTPEEVIGTVIIIPVVNTSGFEHRLPSVLPEDHKNLNRVFPGDPEGTAADRLAYYIQQKLFTRVDYYIDVHCGGIYEDLRPYVYFVGNCDPAVSDQAETAASCCDVAYMVKSNASTGAYNYAGIMGIPSLLLERGGRGRWTHQEVRDDIRDIVNVMRLWGFLSGEPLLPILPPRCLYNPIYHCVEHSGFWYPTIDIEQNITRGQVIGEIRDYHGHVLEVCVAEHSGQIMYMTKTLWVDKATEVAMYAVFCDCDECDHH
ncbi:MAG: sirohydrochlorin cobaltochelatase [Lachnospiraceae bacterium]|nr:sirohydrochlorin cobaltochelatase [Lachnospiraceae bacterium]